MSASLLEVARELATDAAAKAAYAVDPDGFLVERGLADLAPDDLATALEHVADALPASTATQLPPPGPDVDPTAVLDGLATAEPDGADLDFGAGLVNDGDGTEQGDPDQSEAENLDPTLDVDQVGLDDEPDDGPDPVATLDVDQVGLDDEPEDGPDDLDFGGGAPDDLDLDLEG